MRPLVICAELTLIVRLLQTLYVNFVHLKHCLHDPFRFRRIFVMQQLAQNRGNDLSRQAIFIF